MRYNKIWANAKPYISIIIPNFNRKKEFLRAFNSVCNLKTNISFEVIIVDDGSTKSIENEYDFCLSVKSFPICLITKQNGGVHTARNAGVLLARGEYCLFLDSDDELLPDSINTFMDELTLIPKDKIDSIFEIKFRCIDEKGNYVSKELNPNINQISKKHQNKLIHNCGEMIGVRKTSILKTNPFPEPKEITFVMENILWDSLRLKYNSWLSNKVIRIYHTETEEKLTSVKTKTIQHCKNRCWNYCYLLNFSNIYKNESRNRIKCLFIYSMFKKITKKTDWQNVKIIKLSRFFDRICAVFLYPIASIASFMYKRKYLR